MILAIALLVQYHYWSMNWPSRKRILRTERWEQACLVLLRLDSSAHRPFFKWIHSWKSWPCGICPQSNPTVSVSKKIKLDWFGHHDCVLVLLQIVPFRSSQFPILGSSVERPVNLEFPPHGACSSKHGPIRLLRQLHDNSMTRNHCEVPGDVDEFTIHFA